MTRILTNRDLVDITNHCLGTSFQNWRDLNTKIQDVKIRLQEYWDRTQNIDVYEDPEYVYEALNSFGKSKECVDTMCRYFTNDWGGRETGSHTGKGEENRSRNWIGETFTGDVSKMSLLDVYSGNGLTSTVMSSGGFDVSTVGSNTGQLEFQRKTELLILGHELENFTTLPDRTFDVVTSFEVLEHFKEPIPHLRDLMALVKPGGYLSESRGFSKTPNIGHYLEYTCDGQTVSFQSMTKRLTKVLQEEFVMVADCFRKPKIWRRK